MLLHEFGIRKSNFLLLFISISYVDIIGQASGSTKRVYSIWCASCVGEFKGNSSSICSIFRLFMFKMATERPARFKKTHVKYFEDIF